MDRIQIVGLLLLFFTVGWVMSNLFSYIYYPTLQRPFSLKSIFSLESPELKSPPDRIPEERIHVFDDKVIIDLSGATWASYADSNSMDPLLDSGHNGIEVKPNCPTGIKVGDVLSFKADFTSGIIVHRVVGTGYDGEGWFALTKGDNAPNIDPGKRRCEDIHGVLVAVVY